jgi:hypothetical protein
MAPFGETLRLSPQYDFDAPLEAAAAPDFGQRDKLKAYRSKGA